MNEQQKLESRGLLAPGVRLNWRPEGVTVYESIWSILHKFAYLNDVNATAICDVLGDPIYNATRHPKRPVVFSLNDVGPLSRMRLRTLLKLPPAVIDHCVTEPYCAPWIIASGQLYAIESRALRFCDICIAQGFHTPLFQLLSVQRCPMHGGRLTERCQHCESEIPYQASNATLGNAYRCPRCRTLLWPGAHEQPWQGGLTSEESQVLDQYLQWNQRLRETLKPRFWSLAFEAVGNDTNRVRHEALRYASDVEPLPGWAAVFQGTTAEYSARSSAPSLAALPLAARADWCESEKTDAALAALAVDFYPIYKSVRRHLARRFLRRHSRCARLAVTPGVARRMDFQCAWVTGFRQWRQRWERTGFHDEFPYHWQIEFRESAFYLRNLLRQFGITGEPTEEQRAFLTWAGGRWYVFLLLASFRQTCAQQMAPPRWEPPNEIPFLYWRPAAGAQPHELMWWSGDLLDFLTVRLFFSEHRIGRARYRRVLREAEKELRARRIAALNEQLAEIAPKPKVSRKRRSAVTKTRQKRRAVKSVWSKPRPPRAAKRRRSR